MAKWISATLRHEKKRFCREAQGQALSGATKKSFVALGVADAQEKIAKPEQQQIAGGPE